MSFSAAYFKQSLQDAGLKATLPRIGIYQLLSTFKHHPSAEELYQKVSKKHPSISLATIYKTLEVLVQNKLVKKVVTDEDKVRYDFRTDQHIHLYCERTNKITDYEDPELDALLISYFKKKQIPDFTIKQIQINIQGECQQLLKKNKNKV
ncbi:MAG: transcriptional repressor [Sphingobacteriales bacterium]|jgi:Fur family peroxide stress response transcriptional regulator|nr:transcriptional repressor [Sphingobacteriales bacterium]